MHYRRTAIDCERDESTDECPSVDRYCCERKFGPLTFVAGLGNPISRESCWVASRNWRAGPESRPFCRSARPRPNGAPGEGSATEVPMCFPRSVSRRARGGV